MNHLKLGLTALSLATELEFQFWAISDMEWQGIFWFLIPGVIKGPLYGFWGMKFYSTETQNRVISLGN